MKQNETGPSRRNVEALLRELGSRSHYTHVDGDDNDYQTYLDTNQRIEELTKAFNETAEMKRLQRRADEAYARHRARLDQLQNMVARCRRLYQAKGLVPAVLKELDKLVSFANGAKSSG